MCLGVGVRMKSLCFTFFLIAGKLYGSPADSLLMAPS